LYNKAKEKNMTIADLLGYAAAALTTGSFIPQVIKIVKTRQTKDISLGMYMMFIIGVLCWGSYGLMIKSYPVIIANSVGLVLNAIIIFYKLKYK
jgi:MtN3 and saliva related transmembrane protein